MCLAGVIPRVNVTKEGPVTIASFEYNAPALGAVATGSEPGWNCDAIVLAFVIEDGLLSDGWNVEILNVAPGSYDTECNGFTDALGDSIFDYTDAYDPLTDDLFCLRYIPEDCTGKVTIDFTVYVAWEDEEKQPVELDTFIGGATNWLDLKDDVPLRNFSGWDVPVLEERAAIPTVSTWGVTVMALLLLVGARMYFRRRPAAETV